jgi:hypothetical protein
LPLDVGELPAKGVMSFRLSGGLEHLARERESFRGAVVAECLAVDLREHLVIDLVHRPQVGVWAHFRAAVVV